MPRELVEVVLGANAVGQAEEGDRAPQGALVVADVVVGDHHGLAARLAHPGEDTADLPHWGLERRVGPDVAPERSPGACMSLEQLIRRSVDDDQLHPAGKAAEIGGQIRELRIVLPADRQHISCLHYCGLTWDECG